MEESKKANLSGPAINLTDGLRPLPLALLFIVGTLMAAILAVGKLALISGVPPLANSFWMMAGAGILLSPWIVIGRLRPNLQKIRYGLIAGLISVAFPTTLIILAIPHIGSGMASVTYVLPPLLTYMFSIPLGMERASPPRFIGMMIALAGALVIVFPPDGSFFNPWMGLAMLAPISLACGNLYRTRAWPKHGHPIELAAYMLLGAATLTFPVMVLTDSVFLPSFVDTSANQALWLLMSLTALMYVFFFILQNVAGPVYLSQIGYVIVFMGLIFGVWFFEESYPTSAFYALAFIFAGLYLTNKRRNKK